ncbi:uncharacterized protein LOC128677443 [Plodia interpunctella]|uniref:uncharacterized protein LOC128677443 n=1 Tax=Plodia interpunctella TaxID=58824 RepID=UPI002368740A|nr:uncharacterized protein LOC128677443 [Plodia interpunctella]
MSRRERKSTRQVCSDEIMNEARKRIDNGESKRAVAASLGMSESTLRFRLQKPHCATKLGRFDTTFSTEVEANFCQQLHTLDDMLYGLTAKRLRIAAYEYAEKHNIAHRFNRETKIAGKEWLRGFLRRHPDISLRQPTSTSIARAIGFNRPQVERFYINLSALMDKYNFPPQSIYNMDETGISTVPNKQPKVLSRKGKRSVNKISSAERGTNVTIVNAVSATGQFIPTVFIFGRKRMKAELLDAAPPGSVGMVSDSSFINSDLYLDWLTHFKDHAKPTKDQPILLILDNHVSHCTLKAVDFYRANNIIALTLPPHSSHKMQPLDRGFHGALKKFYSSECEKWLRNHPGRAITVYQMASIFAAAFYQAATPGRGVELFKCTGIVPWNPDIFTDADFLASSVTEREPSVSAARVSCESTSSIVSPVQANNTAATVPPQAGPFHSEPQPGPSRLEPQAGPPLKTCIATASVSEKPSHVAETRSSLPISSTPLSELLPFPKSAQKRSFNRKHKKSEVISSSPYKREVEEKENEQKNKPKYVPNAKKMKKSFKKPKICHKKKIWKCGGCSEICKEPIQEDWIACDKCNVWWHENCSDYNGSGAFICDLCK